MLTPQQAFNRVRELAVGKPTTPLDNLEPRPGFLSATHRLVALNFEDAGELQSPEVKKLYGTLDASWLAAFAENSGFSHDDARATHRAKQAAFMDGSSKDLPETRAEYIRQNVERRRMLRQRSQIISTEAQRLAAVVWERSLKNVPKFRAKLVAQEQLIFSATSELGPSPLIRMVDDLPRLIEIQIAKLKAGLGNKRPGQLIPTPTT